MESKDVEVLVLNRQRRRRLETAPIKADAEAILTRLEAGPSEVAVVLVSDQAMAKLNRSYRGKAGPTNVLSFPGEEEPLAPLPYRQLGDVIISVETAEREAEAEGITFEARVRRLLVHGLVHLMGYDHEESDEAAEEMEAVEARVLEALDA